MNISSQGKKVPMGTNIILMGVLYRPWWDGPLISHSYWQTMLGIVIVIECKYNRISSLKYQEWGTSKHQHNISLKYLLNLWSQYYTWGVDYLFTCCWELKQTFYFSKTPLIWLQDTELRDLLRTLGSEYWWYSRSWEICFTS